MHRLLEAITDRLSEEQTDWWILAQFFGVLPLYLIVSLVVRVVRIWL